MAVLKNHLSIPDQVALMKSRGLIISDEKAAGNALYSLNYYRLSGYLHSFRVKGSDRYVSGLTWERLQRIYNFDRRLNPILMFALEDIEETLKTRFSYIITQRFPNNPLIYLDASIYRGYNEYIGFLQRFNQEVAKNSKLPFVKHHMQKYNGQLPMWVAVELFTMGNLRAVYDNLLGEYQKAIAKSFNTGPNQLSNWIKNLTFTRNHLAHFMRVYNFNFGRTTATCSNCPRNFPSTNMIFDQIFTMSCLYSNANEWNNYVVANLETLINEYQPDIELSGLGFPPNWKSILSKV